MIGRAWALVRSLAIRDLLLSLLLLLVGFGVIAGPALVINAGQKDTIRILCQLARDGRQRTIELEEHARENREVLDAIIDELGLPVTLPPRTPLMVAEVPEECSDS